jgi:hypothetical protein
MPAAAIATAAHLDAIEPLLQNEAAEEHVGQGIEVIAEARRQDVPADHRIDVQQPVAADQQRGDDKDTDRARLREGFAHLRPTARQYNQQCEEGE